MRIPCLFEKDSRFLDKRNRLIDHWMRNILLRLRHFKNQFMDSLERSNLESTMALRTSDVFKPPEKVRGMKVLDRDAFAKSVQLNALLVPTASLDKFLRVFKKNRLSSRRAETKPIAENGKYITMNPEFRFETLDQVKLEELKKLEVEQKFHEVSMEIGYGNYKHHEILSGIMPEGVTANSGFERVGHIIHVNLLEEQKPFKNVIGQVLLDTNTTARTVVDKACTIDNTYRNFEMDVIAGEADFIATVVENQRKFEFDFSKVFWNSRLETEHNRIYHIVSKSDVVFDVFAGVGPFSVPLAKKGCKVFANDLNAESYKWLCHNAKLNKTTLDAFNLDGREFIKTQMSTFIKSNGKGSHISVIMNLPGHAVDFLDAFCGLLLPKESSSREIDGQEVSQNDIPTISIYCYTFSAAENKLLDVKTRAEERLGQALPDRHEIRFVRKVSPKKDQFCLFFELPPSILIDAKTGNGTDDVEPAPKKAKLSIS